MVWWWAALVGVWLVTLSSVNPSEVAISAGAALPCAATAVAARRAMGTHSGHVGDYVAWLFVGIVGRAALVALPFWQESALEGQLVSLDGLSMHRRRIGLTQPSPARRRGARCVRRPLDLPPEKGHRRPHPTGGRPALAGRLRSCRRSDHPGACVQDLRYSAPRSWVISTPNSQLITVPERILRLVPAGRSTDSNTKDRDPLARPLLRWCGIRRTRESRLRGSIPPASWSSRSNGLSVRLRMLPVE